MVFINTELCNGCGECIDICPTGALTLQENQVIISQELCRGCEICINSCPQGAIEVSSQVSEQPEDELIEHQPLENDVIRIPSEIPEEIDIMPVQQPQYHLQNIALPAIGSALLWAGREVIPRLANLAIQYLDRRLQSSEPEFTSKNIQGRGQHTPGQRGKGRRCRQRRQRKKLL